MTMRKSKIDSESIERILAELANGESLRKACENAGVARSTFLDLVDSDKELTDRYARVRAKGAEVEFERLQDLAEEPPPLDANGKTDSGWVQWKRLQIDTAKWMLAKKRPERYGDRVEQHHTGSVGLAISIDLGGKQ